MMDEVASRVRRRRLFTMCFTDGNEQTATQLFECTFVRLTGQ